MPDPYLARLGRTLAGIAGSITRYAAPGLSVGALIAAFHRPLGLEMGAAFTLGFFIPIGPVYLAYASGWGMRRTLAQLQQWKEAGLIRANEYDELRRRAPAWFQSRRFGG
jgi:hypothetical protein